MSIEVVILSSENEDEVSPSDGNELKAIQGKTLNLDSEIIQTNNKIYDNGEDILILEDANYIASVNFEYSKTIDFEKILLNVGHSKKDPDIYFTADIVSILKPHQIAGIRFMYHNLISSLHHFSSNDGNGCLLAHCMGLGKTLQAIIFSDIFLHHTPGKTVLCLAPTSTIPNWLKECDTWLLSPNRQVTIVASGNDQDILKTKIKVYHLVDNEHKNIHSKRQILETWKGKGGVLIMGYELFRSLVTRRNQMPPTNNTDPAKIKNVIASFGVDNSLLKFRSDFWNYLIDPGPDLIICDEGHRIKSQYASLSKVLKRVRTLRRVVLTGYPLQNNLIEYWSMIDFVRPGYLGSLADFRGTFERPITAGQKAHASQLESRLGRIKSHVLHTLLERVVQRRDASLLTQSLPPKREYILSVKLSAVQRRLYRRLKSQARLLKDSECKPLDADSPTIAEVHSGKVQLFLRILEETIARGEKLLLFSQSVLTLDYLEKVLAQTELKISRTKADPSHSGHPAYDASAMSEPEINKIKMVKNVNYFRLDGSTPYSDRESSIRLFNMKKTTEQDDKFVENFPNNHHDAKIGEIEIYYPEIPTNNENVPRNIEIINERASELNAASDQSSDFLHRDRRKKLRTTQIDSANDYVSSDETYCPSYATSPQNSAQILYSPPHSCNSPRTKSTENIEPQLNLLNEQNVKSYHLFLLSTRAGSLGINLTAASRVIIFDASWNPCHDVQALARVYRMGQTRPCTVYRFVCHKTLESRVFKRQLHKQNLSNVVVDKTETTSHKHHRLNGFKESSDSNNDSSGNDEQRVGKHDETCTKGYLPIIAPFNTGFFDSSNPSNTQNFFRQPRHTSSIFLRNNPSLTGSELITLLSSSGEEDHIIVDPVVENHSDSDEVEVIDETLPIKTCKSQIPSIPPIPHSFTINKSIPQNGTQTSKSPKPPNFEGCSQTEFEDEILTTICSHGDVGSTWLALPPWLKLDEMVDVKISGPIVKTSRPIPGRITQYAPPQKVALNQQELYIARRILDSYKINLNKPPTQQMSIIPSQFRH